MIIYFGLSEKEKETNSALVESPTNLSEKAKIMKLPKITVFEKVKNDTCRKKKKI